MPNPTTVILDKKQIAHKIKRIAFQIYETNVDEKEVVVAGITQNGFLLAKKIKAEVEKISPIKVTRFYWWMTCFIPAPRLSMA